jgi:hypothetical protein
MTNEELRKIISMSTEVCDACVDVYKDFDGIEIGEQPPSIQRVWELGMRVCEILNGENK